MRALAVVVRGVDAGALELDEEEHVEAAERDRLDREEIAGEHGGRLLAQEKPPARLGASRRGPEPARFSVYRWVVRCCRGCGLRSGCAGRPLRSSSCNRSSMRFWRAGSRARSV